MSLSLFGIHGFQNGQVFIFNVSLSCSQNMLEVSSVFLSALINPPDSGLRDKCISTAGCTFTCNKINSNSESNKFTAPGNNTAQTRPKGKKLFELPFSYTSQSHGNKNAGHHSSRVTRKFVFLCDSDSI